MGKWSWDTILDQALNYIEANATTICVCSSQPTTYSQATSTYKLASGAVSSTDFTVASGDTSGRKVTVAQQSSLSVDSTGSAQHIALVNASSTQLLYVTTCTTQALTSGNTVTVPAWDIEIRDPA